MKNKIKIRLFIVISALAFTFGFYNNFWGLVDQNRFDEFDIYCQSQIIGRVIKAEKDGVFSKAGLTGWVRDKDMTWDEMLHYQFEVYENELDIDCTNFIYYDSQMGGQGMIYALLERISPFSNSQNLKLFWLLTSLSMALILSVFVLWVYKNYELLTALITFILILASPWITLFGRNIYWVLSSSFFPFIVMLILLFKESEKKDDISWRKLFFISIGLVFLKLFLSGFELIISALVMMAIPFFYYLFLDNWKIKFFCKRFISLVIGAISAMLIYTILFTYQLSTLKGDFWYGLKRMINSFLIRTNGDSSEFAEVFKASLESNVIEVISIYIKTVIIELGFIKVRFLELFYILIVFSIFIFILQKKFLTGLKERKENMVLVYITWISILGPLSWFIIFKAHSYVHWGYDQIVFYMPFCLFVFVFIGNVISTALKYMMAYYKKRSWSIK